MEISLFIIFLSKLPSMPRCTYISSIDIDFPYRSLPLNFCFNATWYRRKSSISAQMKGSVSSIARIKRAGDREERGEGRDRLRSIFDYAAPATHRNAAKTFYWSSGSVEFQSEREKLFEITDGDRKLTRYHIHHFLLKSYLNITTFPICNDI